MRAPAASLALLAALACAPPAVAEPARALAMHGQPALAPGFSHLPHADPRAPRGGTLRLARIGSFDSLNPFILRGKKAPIRRYVYDSLMHRSEDEPFTLYPLIAESVETSPDRSWVSFTLDSRARFQDGRPITPEDVAFSWRIRRDHGRPNARRVYQQVSRAEIPDSRTIRFHFRPLDGIEGGTRFDRELPLILGMMSILPAHAHDTQPFDRTTLEPPLGSGPYRVTAVDPGRRVVLERVTDYWADVLPVMRGRRNFTRIEILYYRSDAVALEAFAVGEYDVRREGDPVRWARGYTMPAARDGRVSLLELPHGRSLGMSGIALNTRRAPLDDIRVRQALIAAFDFRWVNGTLFDGAQIRSDSFFTNAELAASGRPQGLERNILEAFGGAVATGVLGPLPELDSGESHRTALRRADGLLRAAGLGVAERQRLGPDGRPMALELLLVDPGQERIGLAYGRWLKRLGIDLSVRTVDPTQYLERLIDYDFDLMIWTWDSSLSPGNEQPFYWSSAAAAQPGTRNYPGIRDAVVDELAASIATSGTRAELVARSRALDRVLRHGHYVVPLYHLPTDRIATWSHLGRPERIPLYGVTLDTWWCETQACR